MKRDREWEREPDCDTFKAHEQLCLMVRNKMSGAWCAYVGVGADHPFYGHDYRDVVPYRENWRDRGLNINEHGISNIFTLARDETAGRIPHGHAPIMVVLACHGGLSYAGRLLTWTGWWFGFHCGHADDFSPLMTLAHGQASFDNEAPRGSMESRQTYRNQAYVRNECENLAYQLQQYARAFQGTKGNVDFTPYRLV